MKEILISIQPQWVEKILNGEKTIEIRKTMPKCELPCKVYIYCSYSKRPMKDLCCYSLNSGNYKLMNKEEYDKDFAFSVNGSVVAEFTLNKITTHLYNFIDCEEQKSYNFLVEDVKNAGFDTNLEGLLDFDEFVENYGKKKPLYAWHIEDLKIYDKQKELSEFVLPNKKHCKTCFLYKDMCEKVCAEIKNHLFRPPQSWCYVESL